MKMLQLTSRNLFKRPLMVNVNKYKYNYITYNYKGAGTTIHKYNGVYSKTSFSTTTTSTTTTSTTTSTASTASKNKKRKNKKKEQEKLNTYAAISRTLYKQILQWSRSATVPSLVPSVDPSVEPSAVPSVDPCSSSATIPIPFDPIPPLTLLPPHQIDKSSLENLTFAKQQQQQQQQHNQQQQDDNQQHNQSLQYYQQLLNLLPQNSILDTSKLIIPIHDSNSVKNVTKLLFALNHYNASNDNASNNDNDSNDNDSNDVSLDTIKERVSLGFEVLKSLNQLSEMKLDQRKQSRMNHYNARVAGSVADSTTDSTTDSNTDSNTDTDSNDKIDNVLFHIGQVVQHKTQRWRGIIVGWDKHDNDNKNKEDNNDNNNDNDIKTTTSLTTKEYETKHEEEEETQNNIEYQVLLDEGDAVLLRENMNMYRQHGQIRIQDQSQISPMIGSKKNIKQNELQPVYDPYLKRIRCVSTFLHFDSFDTFDTSTTTSTGNVFIPGEVLKFEYPLDDASGIVNNDGENSNDKSEYVKQRNQNATLVTNGIKDFASQLEDEIHQLVSNIESEYKDESQNKNESNNESESKLFLISDILKELKSITKEEIENDDLEVALSLSTSPSSTSSSLSQQKIAVQHLSTLVSIMRTVTQVMWHRRTSSLNKHRTQFKLGTIVKHQKYNFRGIVTGWDAYPRTDVSRWDGLQNMKGDINNMPFYHIAADANDTMQAFGQERRFRYVCEENLEIVDHHSSIEESGDSNSGSGANYDINYGLDLDVDLNDEWIISKQDGSTEVEYLAPDQLKFQHDESIGSKEERIVEECMKSLLSNISSYLIDMRSPRTETAQENMNLHLDDIFKLLEDTDCLEDSVIVEEFLKESWKVHETPEVRWSLEDGTEALLRGDKLKALNIFEDIITNQDKNYLEAYNKKATCHYMLGEMNQSIEAAELTCEMEPRHFQAFAGLGLAYNDMAQYDKAAKYFRMSLRLQPWSPVSSRLSVCLDALKRMELQEEDIDQ